MLRANEARQHFDFRANTHLLLQGQLHPPLCISLCVPKRWLPFHSRAWHWPVRLQHCVDRNGCQCYKINWSGVISHE